MENNLKTKEKNKTLSKIQLKILDYISRGYTNDEISKMLNFHISTINYHIFKMEDKTNTVNRAQLVRWGFENNYLK